MYAATETVTRDGKATKVLSVDVQGRQSKLTVTYAPSAKQLRFFLMADARDTSAASVTGAAVKD